MYLNVSINKTNCKWNVGTLLVAWSPQISCYSALTYGSQLFLHFSMCSDLFLRYDLCSEVGHWNFGSAIASKVRKLGSSTTLMGCRPWQIKSAVVLTSCFARLLSSEYGTTLAMASWSVACCNPGSQCSLLFTSITFLCSSECLFKRWYVRLDMLVEYEIATVRCKAYNIPFYQ